MKTCGLFLIVLCCSLSGLSLSAKLTGRVRMLEETFILVQAIRRELMLTHASCTRLLEQVKEKHPSQLLKNVSQHSIQLPFPQAWKQAVSETLILLTDEQRETICMIGSVLGSSDLHRQEEALLQCEEQISELIETEKENCRTRGKLYSSLGILTGLMAAVILI